MTSSDFPSESELDRIFDNVNNAGRWGDDDQSGTLNFVTPEVRIAAASLVRSGRAVSISHPLDTVQSAKNPQPVRHTMQYLAHREAIGAVDEVTIATHGYALTHLDAVAHVYRDGEVYNGRRAGDVVTTSGVGFGDISAQRNGIFTRGVLLDVATAVGRPWLTPDDAVGIAEIEGAERLAGTQVRSGDAVFVRVGLGQREVAEGLENTAHRAGLMPEVIEWLADREVAVYSGDCVEKLPNPYDRYPIFLHNIGLPAMGLVLLDCPDVEPLKEACEAEGRYEFLLTAAPLILVGGTGSPVNPVCVF